MRFGPSTQTRSTRSAQHRHQDFRGIGDLVTLSAIEDDQDSDAGSGSDSAILSFADFAKLPARYASPAHSEEHQNSEALSNNDRTEHGTLGVPNVDRRSQVCIDHLEPVGLARKDLAKLYTLHGQPHEICSHNQAVCEQLGLDEHAHAWVGCCPLNTICIPILTSDRIMLPCYSSQ